MAFAFTLTGKRRISQQEDPETAKGQKWELTYEFSCLTTDTSGAKDIAEDLGGTLTIEDIQVTPDDELVVGTSYSGSTITIAKAGSAITGGFMNVKSLTK